jgi:hypothetical protein
MQTFLPYKDFEKSAEVLDNKRLNKQILEGYQILNVLNNDDPKAGWRNHPAVKMWRGYEGQLWLYIMSMIAEADVRGIKTDTNLANLKALKARTGGSWGYTMPAWYQDADMMNRVTATHKANLYKKDSIYYCDFFDVLKDEDNEPCCEKCNYFWVTHVA